MTTLNLHLATVVAALTTAACLAITATSHAATTCTSDTAAHKATVSLPAAGDKATIKRSGGGIAVDGAACAGPDTTMLAVTGGAGTQTGRHPDERAVDL